jgi:hypothetical protein
LSAEFRQSQCKTVLVLPLLNNFKFEYQVWPDTWISGARDKWHDDFVLLQATGKINRVKENENIRILGTQDIRT